LPGDAPRAPQISVPQVSGESHDGFERRDHPQPLCGRRENDPKKFRSLFTENGYWWDVTAGVKYIGDDVARAADIYSTAFPDMHRELYDLYFDGDVVVVRLSLNGTHKGDLPMPIRTIPATGKPINVPSCDVFTIEGGKVSAFECYYSGTILLGQIGLEDSLKKLKK
jgi:hypothetical protein